MQISNRKAIKNVAFGFQLQQTVVWVRVEGLWDFKEDKTSDGTVVMSYRRTLFTFHTGGSGSGRPSNLPREAGALDGLRSLLNLVLVAAAMDGHHLTGALLHLIRHCERQTRGGDTDKSTFRGTSVDCCSRLPGSNRIVRC